MFKLFNRKPKMWYKPSGTIYNLFSDMAEQPHLLIAGATGSGKSVLVNGIISTLLYEAPSEVKFIFIDPKRVELSTYKNIPHCELYASEPGDMVNALEHAMNITESRYREMQTQGVKKYQHSDLYVIIDELADLMTTNKRQVLPLIQRLAQIGRAAKVHIVACTQCPLATVIPTQIKVNFDARVGLRTRSKQDSRNILGVAGLETLPRYGQGIYMTPEKNTLYNIPMVSDEETNRLIEHWTPRRQKGLSKAAK